MSVCCLQIVVLFLFVSSRQTVSLYISGNCSVALSRSFSWKFETIFCSAELVSLICTVSDDRLYPSDAYV